MADPASQERRVHLDVRELLACLGCLGWHPTLVVQEPSEQRVTRDAVAPLAQEARQVSPVSPAHRGSQGQLDPPAGKESQGQLDPRETPVLPVRAASTDSLASKESRARKVRLDSRGPQVIGGHL